LLIAAGDRYAALSATAAARDEVPPVTYLQTRFSAGAIEATATLDGAFAFFTNEEDASIAVVRLNTGSDARTALTFAGRISTDRAPVGMALSPDGHRLYVTSEVATTRPAQCGRTRYAGSIAVIDVAAALTAPDRAILSTVTAGCSPVRIVLAPDGGTAWVTLRGENSLAAFDTAKLVSSPDASLVRKIVVGIAPVGVALVRGGTLAFVANSNRFDPNSTTSTAVAIDTQSMLAGRDAIAGTYPTGAFPREIREAPQHDVVYVTNYDGGTVEVIAIP
jgi:DNA-binding beta-propeller fold protein YncE